MKQCSLITLAVFAIGVATGAARPWTNLDGRTIEAEMVTADGVNVSLRLADGTVVPVPLATLSEADQAYVRANPEGVPTPVTDRKWPEVVQFGPSELQGIEQNENGGGKFVYRSSAFEFTADVNLLPSLVKEVARTFESTKRLVEVLPWGIDCTPPEGMARYQAVLYLEKSDYVKAGGPANSGGVYMSEDRIFRVPFESLGIRKFGQSYKQDENYDNATLVHEITHQMMHDYLGFMPIWAVEGAAELTSMIPNRHGTFRVVDHAKGLRAYASQSPKERPRKPDMATMFHMTSTEWHKRSADGSSPFGESAQHALYTQAALMVYYFNFIDGGEKDYGRRWMRFMDAAKAESGKWEKYQKDFAEFIVKQEEFLKLPGVTQTGDGRFSYPSSLKPPKPPDSPDGPDATYDEKVPLKHLDILLDGRSEAEVQQEMIVGLQRAGVKFAD